LGKNCVSFLCVTSVALDMQAERQASLQAKCPKLMSRLAMSKFYRKTRRHQSSQSLFLEIVRYRTIRQTEGRADVAKQVGTF